MLHGRHWPWHTGRFGASAGHAQKPLTQRMFAMDLFLFYHECRIRCALARGLETWESVS